MRSSRGFLVLLLLILVFQPSEAVVQETVESRFILAQDDVLLREWTCSVVFVNYDEDLIDESLLLQYFPAWRNFSSTEGDVAYSIEYEFHHASESFVNSLRNFIIDNSVNGSDTGTRLDTSALEFQKNNPDFPQRVFYPRAGRAIDGNAVEDWLIENPAAEPPELGYTFYLFNF
ncbi:MAG: hypothetical protein ACFE7R_11675, partial [Candidatus Hodarchaeota archaeon]